MNINHRKTYLEKISNENEYGRTMLDWISNQSINFNYIHQKMISNYNMYSGKMNTQELKDYISTEIDDEMLQKVQHYDVIISKLRTLVGEMIARPLNYQAVATNKEAMNIRLKKLDELLLKHANDLMVMIDNGYTAQEIDKQNKQGLRSINKFIKSEFKLKSEIEANNIIKYHQHKQNYKELFTQGFEHALISAHELYWVGIKNEPVIEMLNPLNIRYQISPDLKDIQYADWACYEYYITLSDAYNYVGKYINDEEGFKQLDAMGSNNYNPNAHYYNQMRNYIEWNSVKKNFPEHTNPDNSHFTINTVIPTFKSLGLNLVKVVNAEWKSLKKIGIVTRYDDKKGVVKDFVNETYKIDKDTGDKKLSWYWVPEVWTGIRIGDSAGRMYLNIKPKEEQFNDLENPHNCKLGFVGKIYNAVNSEPIALIDRPKAYQYLYSIVTLQIERLLASEIGKVLMLDVNAMPPDMEYPDFAYMLKAFKVAPLDTSRPEFKKANFNSFGTQDLSIAAQAISQRVEFLGFLQLRASEVMGITKEREGRVNQNSNVTDNQQSIIQSNYITENEFFQHENCIKNVLNQFIEVCKIYYKDNPIEAVMLDNNSPLSVTTTDLPYYKYDIFVSSSSKDKDLIKFTDTISQALIQNGYKFSDIIKLMNEDYSIAKKVEMLEKLERERDEIQAKQQELEMQMKKEQSDKLYELELKKIQEKLDEEQIRVNAKLEIAQMDKDLALAVQQFKSETTKYDVDKRTESKDKEIEKDKELNQIKQTKINMDDLTAKEKVLVVSERNRIDDLKNKMNSYNKEKEIAVKKSTNKK